MAGAPLRPDAESQILAPWGFKGSTYTWGFKGSTYTDTKTGHASGQDGERQPAAAAACLSSGQEGLR
jgi:hypothetical protein